LAGHDFREGIRALIIDKDNRPRWRPELLAEVSPAAVDAYFAPLPQGDLMLESR
jgi:enoyl-CoA hydratase